MQVDDVNVDDDDGGGGDVADINTAKAVERANASNSKFLKKSSSTSTSKRQPTVLVVGKPSTSKEKPSTSKEKPSTSKEKPTNTQTLDDDDDGSESSDVDSESESPPLTITNIAKRRNLTKKQLTRVNNALTKEYGKKMREIKTLTQQTIQLNNREKELNKRLASLETKNSTLTRKLAKTEKMLNQVRAQFDKSEDDTLQLRQIENADKAKINELTGRIDALRQQLEETTQQRNEYMDKMKVELDHKESLMRQLNEMEAQYNNSIHENEDSETLIADINRRYEIKLQELKNQLVDRDDKIKELQDENDSIATKYEEYESMIAQLETIIKQRQHDHQTIVDELNEKYNLLLASNQTNEINLQERNDEYVKLMEKLQNLTNTNEQLMQKSLQLTNTAIEAKKAKEAAERRLQEKETELIALQDSLNLQNQTLTEQQQQQRSTVDSDLIVKHKQDIAASQEKISDMSNRINDLTREIDTTRESLSRRTERVAELENSVKILQNRLQTSEHDQRQIMEREMKEKERLRNELVSREMQERKLQEQLDAIQIAQQQRIDAVKIRQQQQQQRRQRDSKRVDSKDFGIIDDEKQLPFKQRKIESTDVEMSDVLQQQQDPRQSENIASSSLLSSSSSSLLPSSSLPSEMATTVSEGEQQTMTTTTTTTNIPSTTNANSNDSSFLRSLISASSREEFNAIRDHIMSLSSSSSSRRQATERHIQPVMFRVDDTYESQITQNQQPSLVNLDLLVDYSNDVNFHKINMFTLMPLNNVSIVSLSVDDMEPKAYKDLKRASSLKTNYQVRNPRIWRNEHTHNILDIANKHKRYDYVFYSKDVYLLLGLLLSTHNYTNLTSLIFTFEANPLLGIAYAIADFLNDERLARIPTLVQDEDTFLMRSQHTHFMYSIEEVEFGKTVNMFHPYMVMEMMKGLPATEAIMDLYDSQFGPYITTPMQPDTFEMLLRTRDTMGLEQYSNYYLFDARWMTIPTPIRRLDWNLNNPEFSHQYPLQIMDFMMYGNLHFIAIDLMMRCIYDQASFVSINKLILLYVILYPKFRALAYVTNAKIYRYLQHQRDKVPDYLSDGYIRSCAGMLNEYGWDDNKDAIQKYRLKNVMITEEDEYENSDDDDS
ncbi:hypothetical protein HT594_00024 [Phenacoccus solenopsis nudivirus]|nr:hypothetical protein HT594_00024 [Phenacoccus solenopsis nudivirus]